MDSALISLCKRYLLHHYPSREGKKKKRKYHGGLILRIRGNQRNIGFPKQMGGGETIPIRVLNKVYSPNSFSPTSKALKCVHEFANKGRLETAILVVTANTLNLEAPLVNYIGVLPPIV